MTNHMTPLDTKDLTPMTDRTTLVPQVYTPKEAETLLRLSKNTVNALLNSGQLRAVRYGRKWLIPHAAIAEFLQAETQ
ncbi:helix-turn-helix domain-containing protein [Deinococcus deserti]|uniref:Putative DNA binding domain protein, excisionase family n=1 Tax=Deinococcus deserti (strain DSM 17065 / CIP 109153 / LMG 22923 / VCD115) TaxID=546414 RepID=C1D0W8_DEIDV|nr:helix-turn-helix domain-containing protein [Deinococcus deserti]ACO45492.1 putative DNA binding domain protein, excisionase family [Deinococcus deserti VCD115]